MKKTTATKTPSISSLAFPTVKRAALAAVRGGSGQPCIEVDANPCGAGPLPRR